MWRPTKEELNTWINKRINATLRNKEFDHHLNKYVERKPEGGPTIQVSVKVDIRSYKSHSPPLECRLSRNTFNSKKLVLRPYIVASTADTGAQANILGLNHLNKFGISVGCLHRTPTVLDCANATETDVVGVFLGCIRGECKATGKTMVFRGMVYVIEGGVILLSQTALRDLGVIPREFPLTEQFEGILQTDDGIERLEANKHGL